MGCVASSPVSRIAMMNFVSGKFNGVVQDVRRFRALKANWPRSEAVNFFCSAFFVKMTAVRMPESSSFCQIGAAISEETGWPVLESKAGS